MSFRLSRVSLFFQIFFGFGIHRVFCLLLPNVLPTKYPLVVISNKPGRGNGKCLYGLATRNGGLRNLFTDIQRNINRKGGPGELGRSWISFFCPLSD